MKKIIILMLLPLIFSCSYSVYSTGYPHLKTVSVLQFENRSSEFVIEENLQQMLVDSFQKDGRLKIVTQSPDCQLEGIILDYSNTVNNISDTGVDEYVVKILFSLNFSDLVQNKIILKKESLVLTETYSSSLEITEFTTEEEARNEIFQNLFDDVIINSLDNW